jgi:hypothetical protein
MYLIGGLPTGKAAIFPGKNHSKDADSKSLYSAWCICFCIIGALSHKTADNILSLFFKITNNVEEVNLQHLPTNC